MASTADQQGARRAEFEALFRRESEPSPAVTVTVRDRLTSASRSNAVTRFAAGAATAASQLAAKAGRSKSMTHEASRCRGSTGP